jgi:hypothetical protein
MAAIPISLIFSAVSTVVGIASSIGQAQQAKSAANYNAKVAENQAISARQEAAANADMQRRRSAKTLGSMQANYAASGVTLEGSPLEILEQSARESELDRQTILWSGESRAAGYEATADLERTRGKNAMASGMLSAAGTAIKGGASLATSDFGSSSKNSGLADPGSSNFAFNKVSLQRV